MKHGALGKANVCKECRKSSSKRLYSQTPIEHRLYYGAKSRARLKGIPFELELADIKIPPVCPVFGTAFIVGGRLAASLDRIDPTKGYVQGNVQVVSVRANEIKSDATLEELEKVVAYVKRTCEL